MVRKSSLFAKASKGSNSSPIYESTYGSSRCPTISGSDGSEFRERGGSQSRYFCEIFFTFYLYFMLLYIRVIWLSFILFNWFYYSENSTNSSGENPRYILSSASSEDLRSNDTLKRHGLLSPFNDLDGIPSELDFYYGIGK